MYWKIILAGLFIYVVSVQLAQGKYLKTLKCYSCDSNMSCHHPNIQICDQHSAELTRDQLFKYFPNVTKATNKEFQCLSMNYVYENSTVMTVNGCLNSDVNICSLNPLNRTWILKECRSCSTDLCTLPTSINGTFSNTNKPVSTPTVHHSSHSSSTLILCSSMVTISLIIVNMLVK